MKPTSPDLEVQGHRVTPPTKARDAEVEATVRRFQGDSSRIPRSVLIRRAVEAGRELGRAEKPLAVTVGQYKLLEEVGPELDRLLAAAKAEGAREEREACEQLAKDLGGDASGFNVANAIRARRV